MAKSATAYCTKNPRAFGDWNIATIEKHCRTLGETCASGATTEPLPACLAAFRRLEGRVGAMA